VAQRIDFDGLDHASGWPRRPSKPLRATTGMIALQDVSKAYRERSGALRAAVSGIDLTIERGELLVITGHSGAGKTTLLNLCAGLSQPSSGKVLFGGIDLWRLSDGQRARLRGEKIGFVFQLPSLLPALTALENVLVPTLFNGTMRPEAAREQAAFLLHSMGLGDRLAALPQELSAGAQRRVAIARALINRPQVLLADEPTGDVDARTEQEIMALLQQMHRTAGMTVVVVTHSPQLAGCATRTLEMAGGRLNGARDADAGAGLPGSGPWTHP